MRVKVSPASRVLVVAILVSMMFAGLAGVLAREAVTEPSLLDLQKILARKKFVDLTHDFAPGIPRWSGFPDEQRKTIYWYDKQPEMMGDGFSRKCTCTLGSGARTSIRRRISTKACAQSIKSIRKK